MLTFYDFIQVYVFTINHHLKRGERFENFKILKHFGKFRMGIRNGVILSCFLRCEILM